MSNDSVDPIIDVLIPMLKEAYKEGQKPSVKDEAWEPFQPWKFKCGQSYIVLSEKLLDEMSAGNPEELAADTRVDFYIYIKEPLHCRRCNLPLIVKHESDFAAANARHSAIEKADMAIPTSGELELIAQESEVCEIMKLHPTEIYLTRSPFSRGIFAEVTRADNTKSYVALKTTRFGTYKTYFEQVGISVGEYISSW